MREDYRPIWAARAQRRDGIQAQQTRRGPLGPLLRPLQQCLEAQMGTAFLKGCFHKPGLNVC